MALCVVYFFFQDGFKIESLLSAMVVLKLGAFLYIRVTQALRTPWETVSC